MPRHARTVRYTCLAGLLITMGTASAAPNVVVLLVDDLGWQDTSLPFADHTTPFNRRYRTPNLERLAADGMRFTDAYASAPVCTPTRTSIMTGRSPGRSHITYWTLHRDRDTSKSHPTLTPPLWNMNGLTADDVTLPGLLRDAGYRTIHLGKADFGAHGTSGADPRNLGFDVNIAGHASGGPASYYGRHDFSLAGRQDKDPGSSQSVWDIPGLDKYHGRDVYLTEVLALEATRAMRDAVDAGQTFYLYLAPYAVHAPIMANSRYQDHYADLHPAEAAYATMIETVDAALGSILDTLDDLGIADETVVIYTSDNGGLSAHARGPAPTGETAHTHNAPLRSGKGSAYEGGTRVPAVVRWPGHVAPGSVCDTPIISHDLFPTVLHMAGLTVPEGIAESVDGRDLTPLLEQRGIFRERAVFWHQPHQWGAPGPGIEPFTAVRSGPWKLIHFHAGPRFELYDLDRDIGETTDLATTHAETTAALAAMLDEWITRNDVQPSIVKSTGRPIEMPGPASASFLTAHETD